jgi:hypothetical protein
MTVEPVPFIRRRAITTLSELQAALTLAWPGAAIILTRHEFERVFPGVEVEAFGRAAALAAAAGFSFQPGYDDDLFVAFENITPR